MARLEDKESIDYLVSVCVQEHIFYRESLMSDAMEEKIVIDALCAVC